MTLNKKQREKLRLMFGGRCAYCGCELPEKGWHVDHLKAIYRGSVRLIRGEDGPENYFPACRPCNLFKSVYPLEMWREEIGKQVERARKQSFNFRFAEKFGLVQETKKPVIFWFEEYNARKLKG